MLPKDLRQDFPPLSREIDGKPVIYLDSGCTTLKPQVVIDAITEYYTMYPACAGRSSHKFGVEVTEHLDSARESVANFINAGTSEQIVFSKSATEGINLVAHGIDWQPGDRVITTDHEHNANLVPWMCLKRYRGVEMDKVISTPENILDLEKLEQMMSSNVKLVTMAHVCNLDGHVNPVEEAIKMAHDHGAQVLLDAAQSVPHKVVDVKKLDVDYLAFSPHKMCGPPGVGVLYGREGLLDELRPMVVGGGCVTDVNALGYRLQPAPRRLESGTQNAAGILGTAAAVKYLIGLGLSEIEAHEKKLNSIVDESLSNIENVSIMGPKDPQMRGGITGFNIAGAGHHELARMLDQRSNIMVRSGKHCNHAWFAKHKLTGSVRASFYLYNTEDEARFFAEEITAIAQNFEEHKEKLKQADYSC